MFNSVSLVLVLQSRRRGCLLKTLGLDDESLSRDALIKAMIDNPILIERPIVITNKGIAIGRPIENVKKILS